MNRLKRTGHILLALLMAVSTSSYFFVGRAAASTAGILDTRSIQLSSSQSGANNVQATFKFNIGTTGNVGSLAVDFCDEDPLQGDTCSAPGTGGGASTTFSTNSGTLGAPTGQNTLGTTKCGVTDLSLSASSTSQTLIFTRPSATSLTSGCTMSFIVGNGTSTGFQLPNLGNYPFYARIFTYATTTGATSPVHTPTSVGTPVDFGGIALTTTAQLSITAKVEEQLTLCLYASGSCAQNNKYSITIGDANGILSVSHSYSNIATKFDVSTNAANGVNIYAYFPSSLKSPQGNIIAGMGTSPATSQPGTAQFGFCGWRSSGTASITFQTPYNNANCNSDLGGMDGTGTAQFGFDTSGLAATGGQLVAATSGPTTPITNTLAFVANISSTTPAGSYSTTMTLIGVGSY